jgi:hypothetical protein
MSWSQLDFFFPYLVFFYGFLLVFVLEVPLFTARKTASVTALLQHLEPKRKFAWVCLVVGAFWSLQNLIFT